MLTREYLKHHRSNETTIQDQWKYDGNDIDKLISKINLIAAKVGADEIYLGVEANCLVEEHYAYIFISEHDKKEPVNYVQQVGTLLGKFRVYVDWYSPMSKVLIYNSKEKTSGIVLIDFPPCPHCEEERLKA